MYLFLTYNKCIPTPYITLFADKWNSKFEPLTSLPQPPYPPSQLHLTAYYSKLLAIFGQQFGLFTVFAKLLNGNKRRGGGICLVPRDKRNMFGGGGGMHALTYYVAHQGSRSPAHLIKLDILLPCWALLCNLNN